MSNIRKLATFRQLSLNCESPTPEQRRKSLKKQFSEDIPDFKDDWMEPGVGIKISLNEKSRKNLDRPPPIKIAWEENITTNEAVIVKKCKELKRPTTSKLTRHNSLEKDSILCSKQELTDRLRNVLKEKEPEKPNLNIFLAQHSFENEDDFYLPKENGNKDLFNNEKSSKPKLMQPLFTTDNNKNIFQIRKNPRPKINLNEIAYSPTRSNDARTNPVVVIPIIERNNSNKNSPRKEEINKSTDAANIDDHKQFNLLEPSPVNENPKAINTIIIRPSTAAVKREKFQKRTNSAFNSTVNETSSQPRPPLLRSSSAPSKPEKTKFIPSKRRIKTAKKFHIKSQPIEDELDSNNKENPKTQKELNRSVLVNGVDIVTMVSLVSPAGSDNEESPENEKDKSKAKSRTTSPSKNNNTTSNKKEEHEIQKNLSLRKTVKSVSFQQSSIHAIRSFSASFPARRSSMATTLMLSNSNIKPSQNSQKIHEKRSTNSTIPDDDERVPKRRLVRSQTDTATSKSKEPECTQEKNSTTDETHTASDPNFSVDIKAKKVETIKLETKIAESETSKPDVDVNTEDGVQENETEEVKFESPKEKQCWDMFCKMSEKGINVSYDTILRGMLTPTEYRMRRKASVTPSSDNC